MGHAYNFRETAPGPKVGTKPGPKVMKELVASRAANGGHVITHRFHNDGPGPYIEPEDHVFGQDQGAEALAHIAKHLGIKAAAAPPAAAAASPAAGGGNALA